MISRNTLSERHKELRLDFEAGQKRLQRIEEEQADLKQTLYRISGAIQVLEELMAENNTLNGNGAHEKEEDEKVSPERVVKS